MNIKREFENELMEIVKKEEKEKIREASSVRIIDILKMDEVQVVELKKTTGFDYPYQIVGTNLIVCGDFFYKGEFSLYDLGSTLEFFYLHVFKGKMSVMGVAEFILLKQSQIITPIQFKNLLKIT